MDGATASGRAHDHDTRQLIADRLVGICWMAFFGIGISLLVDLRGGIPPWPIAVAKSAALVGLPLLGVALRHVPGPSRSALVALGIATVWLIGLVSLTGGVVTEDPMRAAFVASFLALGVSVFVPWGGAAHLALVVLMLAAFAGAFGVMAGAAAVPLQSLFATGAAAGASVYVAFALDLQRRAQAEAERVVRQQAADLRAQAVELVAARDAALVSSRTQADFLANMSHELRTPVHGVLGLADILCDAVTDPEQRELVERIRRCGMTLSTLIDDVLDFERMATGQLTLRQDRFDPTKVLDEIIGILAPMARAKRLHCEHRTDPSCPRLVEGDRVRFMQIVNNLVSNAVKFTDTGQVAVDTNITRSAGQHVGLQVVVRDTGVGIPAELHEAIFQPFRQADGSMTRPQGGVGLGLTIARQLVEMMDGRMGLESAPGKGSAFWVEVPFRVIDAGDLRVAP
jgi:signal transduction histidine kinase